MFTVKQFFKQKMVLGGLLGIMAAVIIASFAFMGSTVNPVPKDLPIAMVIQDTGTNLPGQGSVNLGNKIKEQVLQNKQNTIKWTFLQTKKDALQGMKEKKYYAAIIFPPEMSQQLVSLTTPKGQQTEVQILVNQGLNYNASMISNQMIDKLIGEINENIRHILLDQLSPQNTTLTTEQAKLLASPLIVKTELIHPVQSHTGNGNVPVMLTQILWITTLISSLILFMAAEKFTNGRMTGKSVLSQILAGSVFVIVIASLILFIAHTIIEVNIPNQGEILLLFFFFGFMFFLLQSALLNWVGRLGVPILMIVFFFSMPILSLAYEFLPDVTKHWLYSWSPFKYSVEALRSSFFFEGYGMSSYVQTMGLIGLVSLIIMVLSVFKKDKQKGSISTESV
ncbi:MULTISPECIES: YhgE/Pip domain-containing protein [Bacillus]|uniref:YhgE/Pip domain-containing protein n=1 Tax=Bacillus TaxID=1386 RepID=UPI00046A1399|nr:MULTISPECIES: ABC transporter permease [Bacillus]MED1412540.1 ABC transporter permease [Bacillus paramycoides]MED1463796.1 ABC transporter permease [Bacillus paramycoides]MED1495393.1 ABC transporter permease [Bacillus paramycoides]